MSIIYAVRIVNKALLQTRSQSLLILFFKGDERLGRNDVRVAGQCVLVKTASGATGNESGTVGFRPAA